MSKSPQAHDYWKLTLDHAQTRVKKMPDSDRCRVNAAVISALKRLLGTSDLSESVVEQVLKKRGVPAERAETLAHTLMGWDTPKPLRTQKWTTPNSRIVLELAEAFDVSLDVFFDHHTTASVQQIDTNGKTDLKGWLRGFLAQSRNLSCYVAFVGKNQIGVWRDQATPVEGEDDRLKLADSWTKEIRIFDASFRLRQDHDIRLTGSLQDKTMENLISSRLRWIKNVPKIGTSIADMARKEILLGIFETVRTNKDSGAQCRYPTQKGTKLKSLRVRDDSVPSHENEVGWVVYYNWGPPMKPAELEELLNSERSV